MKKFITLCIVGMILHLFAGIVGAKSRTKVTGRVLKAGASKVEVTPRFERWATTRFPVPYYARVLVLENGEDKIVLISCDLRGVNEEFCNAISKQITKNLNVLESQIMICSSHTHSIPKESLRALWSFSEKASSASPGELAWIRSLPQKIAQAVDEANSSLVPATLGVGKGYEDTIGLYSRRWMKDGNISWAGPRKEQGPPAGPYDAEVGVILVRGLNGNVIGTIWNYACHPMGRIDTGDYVGWTSRAIEQELGGIALFTQGASGNIHNDYVLYEPGEEMARPITYEVLRVARKIEPSTNVKIMAIKKEIILPGRDFNTVDPEQIRIIAGQAKGRSKEVESMWLQELRERRKENKRNVIASIQVLSIGEALLVGIPGEFFAELGMQIKWNSARRNTFLATSTNGRIGYIPTQVAYQQGGYQTLQRAQVAPGAGEQIVQEALSLISKLLEGD